MGRAEDWRDEAATALVLRHLAGLGVGGRVLVMEDPRPDAAAALSHQGAQVTVWNRRVRGDRPASAWPPAGPFDAAFLRLPRAKEELEMMAHMAAARLAPEGRLLVYGAKDEGIGSASRRLEPVFEVADSLATGGRCRLLEARGPRAGEARPDLSDWRVLYEPPLPELGGRPWVSFPGVFACGRLDEGTAVLLDALPALEPGSRVLDFGCGDGVIAAVVAARTRGTRVDLLDADALALRAAEENVPDGTPILADGIAAAPGGPWDVIVSNPPFHAGKRETMEVVGDLVETGPTRLAPGGMLFMVTQRRLSAEGGLRRAFERVEVLSDDGAFRVWWAQR